MENEDKKNSNSFNLKIIGIMQNEQENREKQESNGKIKRKKENG